MLPLLQRPCEAEGAVPEGAKASSSSFTASSGSCGVWRFQGRLCLTLSLVLLAVSTTRTAPLQQAKSQSSKLSQLSKASQGKPQKAVARTGFKPSAQSKLTQPNRSFALQVGKPVEVQVERTVPQGSFKVEVMGSASGRLISSFIQRPKSDASFLTLPTFKVETKQKIFPFQGKGVVSGRARDPQWSPDGRYVLFKYGDIADIRDTFSLYVWDTQTNALQLVSSHYISYLQVSWSPDSNYIAFVLNGDIFGGANRYIANSADYIGPLQLYVCNWRTGEEHLVTSNDTVHGPFSWIAPHTLLYDMLSHKKQEALLKQRVEQWKKSPSGPKSGFPIQARPDIYEYSIEEKRSHLLIAEGTRAVPSPDGQHIAFFGPSKLGAPLLSQEDWTQAINGDSLCVALGNGTGRVALNREFGFYPSITWMPDSQHLLSLQQTQPSPTAEAQIKQWNIKEGTFQNICVLKAKDYQEFPTHDVSPTFRIAGISPDSKFFYVITSEVTGEESRTNYSTNYTLVSSLQQIQLDGGQITPVVRLTDSSGVDWFPSTPSP